MNPNQNALEINEREDFNQLSVKQVGAVSGGLRTVGVLTAGGMLERPARGLP